MRNLLFVQNVLLCLSFNYWLIARISLQNEVDLLGKIQHPNIISLLGYCVHGEMRFLVYELMQNGSLETQLHGTYLSSPPSRLNTVKKIYSWTNFLFLISASGPSHGSALTWHIRMKIALDAARLAVTFLHLHEI